MMEDEKIKQQKKLRKKQILVGSYSSIKWFWISWMVRADFPCYSSIQEEKKKQKH
jgi:hypothetical protein